MADEAAALRKAEAILSLLYHRGIVDSDMNREDVAAALTEVRAALGMGGTYTARPKLESSRRRWWWRHG